MWTLLLRSLLGEVGPLVQLIIGSLQNRHVMDQVLVFAQAEVARLEGDTSLDSEAKRKAAEAAVLASLKLAGLDVARGVVNLCIEVAYNAMKAQVAA